MATTKAENDRMIADSVLRRLCPGSAQTRMVLPAQTTAGEWLFTQ
jgi:hypothetical protein